MIYRYAFRFTKESQTFDGKLIESKNICVSAESSPQKLIAEWNRFGYNGKYKYCLGEEIPVQEAFDSTDINNVSLKSGTELSESTVCCICT